MYNDESNLYHYTYRKDGSEPSDSDANRTQPSVDDQIHAYQASSQNQSASGASDAGTQEPIRDLKPARKHHTGAKFVALALSCALVGGAAGAGITYFASGASGGSESINVSSRSATQVSLKKVDGKTEMSDAENYSANVNSVVSINTTGSSGTNIFGQSVQTASAGSGFIITTDGYIVTNHHVIADANSVKVTLYNGDSYNATIVGSDEDYDIAVLKINATGLQAVTLGDSDTLNVGDHVLAIGNPLGELTFSMTGGMVSCVNRAINVDGTPFNMIQTDTSINPGNSGGPLLNSYGEVIGIVSAKYSSDGSSESVEGLGFAIPINDVAAMIQDIMTNGYVTNKAYLGVSAGSMNATLAQQYRYSVSEGVFIYSVDADGAAAKAGLKMGDVITKIDDTTISSLEDLTAAKKTYSAGDTATFTIYRDGKTQTLKVTWGSQPAQSKTSTDTTTGATQNGGQNNQDNQNGQSGQNDQNMQDLFNYFFGQNGAQNGTQSGNGQSGANNAA
jgi:serine protease Do